MGRWIVLGVLLAISPLGVTSCNQSSTPPPPHYRVTGTVRASCYQEPAGPQSTCTMHAQIQNDGGPGAGGIGQLILLYRAVGSDTIIAVSCEKAFPQLDSKDVAEIDCVVHADQVVYSSRIVGTDIKILTSSTPSPTI